MSINPDSPSLLRIAAAILLGRNGRTLLVRKRGTIYFMQPGGKIEPYEEPVAALVRELREELSLIVDPSQPVHLGSFTAPAANEPGICVIAELFGIDTTADLLPAAEIEEIVWVDPRSLGGLVLAPLTRDYVLPLCVRLIRRRLS
jgi:8-oxo-dGTP diphosphatase